MFNINNFPKIKNFLSPVGDSSGSAIGYIFQDSFMNESWNTYGQMMMDSTFGVTNCYVKMFTLMVIDPENFSKYVVFY